MRVRRARRPRRVDPRRERFGFLAAELAPAPFDHRGPALVLGRAQLLHRDVVVGLHVVLDEAVDDLDLEAVRARDRRRGLTRAQLRTRDDRVDVLVREPRRRAARPARVPAAVSGGLAGTPVPDSTRSGSACLTQMICMRLRVLAGSANPSACSSSTSATSGSVTLIVVMPIARAGLRLMPRSSRNTLSDASHAEPVEHELVDPRVGLAQPLDRRLDDDVEREGAEARWAPRRPVGRRPVVGERRDAQALGADALDRVHHRAGARRSRRRPMPAARARRARSRRRSLRARAPRRTRPSTSSPRSSAAHAPGLAARADQRAHAPGGVVRP